MLLLASSERWGYSCVTSDLLPNITTTNFTAQHYYYQLYDLISSITRPPTHQGSTFHTAPTQPTNQPCEVLQQPAQPSGHPSDQTVNNQGGMLYAAAQTTIQPTMGAARLLQPTNQPTTNQPWRTDLTNRNQGPPNLPI